jgi:hypothetical protein
MPAPFILPANPTFGTQLAQQLSQGVNKGLEKGIAAGLSGMLQQKKELGKAATNVNLIAKRYGKDAFDAPKLAELQNRTSQLIKEGNLSAQDASLLAFLENDEKGREQQELEEKENPQKGSLFNDKEIRKSIEEDQQKSFNQLKETWENIKGAGSQFLNPFIGHLETVNKLLDLTQMPQRYIASKTNGESNKEFFEKEGERFNKKLDLQDAWTEITEGRNLPKNIGDRLIQAWIGAGGHPAGAVVQGYQELKDAFGIQTPEWMQPIEDSLLFVLAVKNAKKFDLRNSPATRYLLKRAQVVADKIQQPVESVIQKAANEGNVNLQKAASGDVAEINKLKGRITAESPGSEKVQATEKTVFNPKEAIKQREAHGKKLEASPFRENFEIENKKAKTEAGKTPETKAKEAEVARRLEPKIAELEKRIDSSRKELARMESYAQKYTGSAKDRLKQNIEFKRKAIEKQMEELKDLHYELKNGKPRPTEAQLEIDAQKSAQKIVDQVKNPTPENLKAFEDQLAKDQRFLDRAAKIKERGEFTNDVQPDTHIRTMEKYQKAYDAMIMKLKDEINSLKGARDAESLKRISENREAIKRLEQRQKRHKANITNQREKITALASIQGPSGALYKNQIKRTQGDLKEFQKDFAEFKKRAETKSEIGTEKKGQQAIKESGKEFEKATKVGEEVGKNPTEENIAKAAEETGLKPEEIKTEQKKLGELFKEHAEKVREGRATERDVKSTEREINKTLGKWNHRLKGTAKSLALSYITGVAKGIIENETGVKIPSSYLTLASTVLGKPTRLPGRFVGLSLGTRTANAFYNSIESSKLKDLRKNPIKYSEYVQNLRKRYSAKRVNEMIEGSKK